MLKSIKEDSLRLAQQREETVHQSLAEASTRLDAQLKTLKVPISAAESGEERPPKPCESFRTAVMDCYRRNVGSGDVLVCAKDVRAFKECAKQLCDVTSK